jgi:hypothetical protein
VFRNRFKIPGSKTQAVNIRPASPGTNTDTGTDTNTNTKPANTLL